MRRRMLALLLPLCLHAGGWDPVPPETWAIKADSTKSSSGAIYLLDWSRYGVTDTEHRLRILILSEAGKAAVQLEPFSPLLDKVEGRVLYPDGKETDFSKAEDFSNRVVKAGSNDVTQKVVVPPGLTDHCIVDLHWSDRGTVLWGERFDRWIQRSYPIKNLELRLVKRSPLGSVWLKPASMAIEAADDGEYKVYKLKDLPALETEPYSREAWRFNPKLMCFAQPTRLNGVVGKPQNVYWDTAAKNVVKPEYEDRIVAGSKYRALAQDILNGLPVDPIQRGQAIVDRMYGRILNVSAMTATEAAARTKRESELYINSMNLNDTAHRGWTDGSGMFYLAYQLCVDAGLHPKLLLGCDRDKRGFRYDLPDFFQFDDVLLGIGSSDGRSIMWLDPSIRFLPTGVIDPSYQGTKAIVVDSSDWTAHAYQVPVQAPGLNRRDYQYEVRPGEEEDAFSVHVQFSGCEEWFERNKYYALSQKDSEKNLKEALESGKQYSITKTSILDAAARGKPFAWEAEGTREAEGSRRRGINPFPDMECPLWIPSAWPEHRLDPVVMPYASIYKSTSRIQIPDGWKATLPDPVEKTNLFGKVSWNAKETQDDKGKAVVVSFEVTVSTTFGAPASEGALRDFLAWVQDSWNQRVGLEKSR